MNYLSRLEAAVGEYSRRYTTANTAKSAFDGFSGDPKTSIVENAVFGDECVTAQRWMIHFVDHPPVDVLFSPGVSGGDAVAAIPGAVAASAIRETAKRQATSEEAAELSRLVPVILFDDAEFDRSEALEVALADPVAALESFRALAAHSQRQHT